MGVVRNEHGTYYARKKVPRELEEATAQVLGRPQVRVSWLKRSLGTKDLREANIRAKPVLIEFDKVLARARAALTELPLRETLTPKEIERIAGYHYAAMLTEDDELRQDGDGSEEVFAAVAAQLAASGIEFASSFKAAPRPTFGMTDRQWAKNEEAIEIVLPTCERALARGEPR